MCQAPQHLTAPAQTLRPYIGPIPLVIVQTFGTRRITVNDPPALGTSAKAGHRLCCLLMVNMLFLIVNENEEAATVIIEWVGRHAIT